MQLERTKGTSIHFPRYEMVYRIISPVEGKSAFVSFSLPFIYTDMAMWMEL